MFRRLLLYLSVSMITGAMTHSAHAQGMSAGAGQGRGQSFGMQQRQRADEGLARRDVRAADPEERGSERAMEMRDRRDERREIMDDYRATREPGQEGRPDPEDREDAPQKKRWWRFWDRD